jgi:hypothetical protein
MKKIAYDQIKVDQMHIIQDTKCCLKVNAIISKAGVYKYEDGWALKPKMELLKASNAIRYAGAKLTLHKHPDSKIIMSQSQLFGGIEKPFFERDKIRAVLNFDKALTPKPLIQKIRDAVANKTGLDVSIGFYYNHEPVGGVAADVNTGAKRTYDYVMRDILIDHVAVMFDGDHLHGRCTFPNCGIGVDTLMQRIGLDPFAGYKDFDDCVAKNQDKDDPEAYCATIQRQVEGTSQSFKGGINMSEKKPEGWTTQTTKEGFEECVRKTMETQDVTREQAEALCLPPTKPADEPTPYEALDAEELTPYQKCIKEKMDAGATLEEAQQKCKGEGVTKEDQDAAFDNCVERKMEEGKSREEAEKECREEHPVAEEDQVEGEVTDLDRCIAAKVELGMSEAEARQKCEAEQAGKQLEAADTTITESQKLIKFKREHDIEKHRPKF